MAQPSLMTSSPTDLCSLHRKRLRQTYHYLLRSGSIVPSWYVLSPIPQCRPSICALSPRPLTKHSYLRICLQGHHLGQHHLHRCAGEGLRCCSLAEESRCKTEPTVQSQGCAEADLCLGQTDRPILRFTCFPDLALRRMRDDRLHSRCSGIRRPCPW